MNSSLRSNEWLRERFRLLHEQYFPDVAIENKLVILFGKKTRNRLGSIIAYADPTETQMVSYIRINGLFRRQDVPEFVIDATLAHEFVHYTHGFHSPRRQLYKHPHRGNIVNKELETRGALHLYEQQKVWLDTEYNTFLTTHHPRKSGQKARKVRPTLYRLARKLRW